ncbi:MAG: hypothetical protein WBA74_02605 [Cyclobacteriaceae bacterium]
MFICNESCDNLCDYKYDSCFEDDYFIYGHNRDEPKVDFIDEILKDPENIRKLTYVERLDHSHKFRYVDYQFFIPNYIYERYDSKIKKNLNHETELETLMSMGLFLNKDFFSIFISCMSVNTCKNVIEFFVDKGYDINNITNQRKKCFLQLSIKYSAYEELLKEMFENGFTLDPMMVHEIVLSMKNFILVEKPYNLEYFEYLKEKDLLSNDLFNEIFN